MIAFDTLLGARDAVRAKDISATQLTRQALARIEALDKSLSAFNSTYPTRALERAKAVDDGRITGP